jgi:hypothetical protein
MVWSLFATQLERADTLEATNLTIGAPALYSAANRFFWVHQPNRSQNSGSFSAITPRVKKRS